MLIEQSRGQRDWTATDKLVGGLASRGIRPFPFAWGSPSWTRSGGFARPPLKNGAARQAWEDFLKAAVDRYGPQGSYWTHGYPQQFGQDAVPFPSRLADLERAEPQAAVRSGGNGRACGPAIRPAAADLHDAITSRDPQAKIVTAGFITQKDPNVFEWLESFYSVPGSRTTLTLVAQHGYAPPSTS